ncbi:MAG: response regulator transcription factor [Acidobacteriota bacterium]
MKERLLLIEDDPALARGLRDNFVAEGYDVRHESSAERGEAALREQRSDVVVLDIMLPGRSGLDLLRALRAAGDTVPVLMLTAKGEVVDRVVGLELGADDYLPKPFALRELLARVSALVRRARKLPAGAAPREIAVGAARFDFAALQCSGPRTTSLTTRDILVMKLLAERRGEVVTREDIVEEICGLDSEATLRTVDNHVVALRRALGDDPRRPRWLHTVRGVGYRLAPETKR